MLSNSPTPLYAYWQQKIGFSSGTLTLIFAAYIIGLITTLLFAGQLADRYGRKRLLVPGLIGAILATLLFETANSVTLLFLARLLTGIAVGIVVTAGMALVVDHAGPSKLSSGALLASMAIVIGAGLGPLFAGIIVQYKPEPTVMTFTAELVILLSAIIALIVQPANVRSHENERRQWRLPTVPGHSLGHVLIGIAFFGPGISATSFVLSLGPSMLSPILHVQSPLIAGTTACAMFGVAVAIQLGIKKAAVNLIFLVSGCATCGAMTLLIIALHWSSAVLLILAALLAGAAQGAGQLGGFSLIAQHVPDNRRAEANALFNLGGYLPAGLLPILTGIIIDVSSLEVGAFTLATLLGLAAFVALIALTVTTRPRRLQKKWCVSITRNQD
ncbi:putative multi-drug efflux transporter [Pseudomonas asuensis]|uniref:Multi-drug efflux transporter n=2 Tax=Pseudomonas asuensis TaxID=1825787 RepID=A0ABQ2H2K5_9PSED|nr:putative multi-drug efflux transporter [Pseudomonas asuensis]